MKFKGWGTSLAWWANINYPSDVKDKITDLIFGENGLSLNIVRYNLGGGKDPDRQEPNLRQGGMVPCIKSGPNEEFNLQNDEYQISILDKAINLGVNHVELFVNSPPWWMTISGKTSGSDKIATNNLKKEKIDEYADFLIDSYNLMIKKYPVTSLAPFNEPSNPFWTSSGSQEGCYFDFSSRVKVIKSIKSKDPNLRMSSADTFSSGFALFWYLFSPKKLIDQINIHGYAFSWKGYKLILDDFDIWRYLIRYMTSKPIWMSEFGMGGPDKIENALILGRQIFRDLKTLRPEAWVYWQVIENEYKDGWGLIQVVFGDLRISNIKVLKQYWVMMHFTKTLKENDTYKFINDNVLEIRNQLNNKLGYIILNDKPKIYDIDKDILDIKSLLDCKISDRYGNYKTEIKVPNILEPYSIMSIVYDLKDVKYNMEKEIWLDKGYLTFVMLLFF
jgi:hypothetical protein